MNVADSDFVADALERRGYERNDSPENSDFIVVNTCTVRQHAEDRALSYLGTLRKIKTRNPATRIFLIGCAATRLGKEIKRRFPHVDGVIPAPRIESFDTEFKGEGVSSALVGQSVKTSASPYGSRAREFVTISRGCSNFCSYCIVPYVRGPQISRSPREIISDVEDVVKSGSGRITLLGQNVNSYSSEGMNFARLLKTVSAAEGVESVGFLTSHPRDMSDEIIISAAAEPKVRKHFHLPVQSGSDRILSLMNRGYTRARYLKVIESVRGNCPSAEITTDIIVGYPSEKPEEFEDTLSLIREADFDGFFAFKYSPREGTASAVMADDVSAHEKERRLARALELCPSKGARA